MAEQPTQEISGSTLTNAVAIFLPVLRALILEAESSGKSGPEKHAAVSEAAEMAYRTLQSSVKELRIVPWMLISPMVVPAAGGFISVLVSVLNKLWGKLWSFVSRVLE